MRDRVAIVVPRCADAVHGGAENLALQLARDLQASYEVEILTTCATEYRTWENTLAEGLDHVEGIAVRRFRVDLPRNGAEFDRLSRTFRYRIASLSISEQESWMREQGPYSTPLLRYLTEQREHYDAFVFLPYLYATTYFGLPLVRDRAILLPLAHDEWTLYLPMWDAFFRDVRAHVYVTPEERELLARRFRDQQIVGPVIHPGIATLAMSTAALTRAPQNPFMLYLGRFDDSKGTDELREHFIAYLDAHPQSAWSLVFAGPGEGSATPHERIANLGAVDEATKWALLRACDVFAMPSHFESLSIAMTEAWRVGTPSLVNGWNTVLVGQTRRANGGLWYHDQRTFDAVLDALDAPTRARLGAQGQSYVERTYTNPDTANVIKAARVKLAKH